MLGDYQLVRKLGQGGMGAVYEAVQTKLDRKVALKVLPQKFTNDPTFLERFQREAKAAAALNHPNIIQVYDIGEARGTHFFAMELVDGESAQDRLDREGKLPLEWALHIVRGTAEALRYAHQHQIIHRDIKPDNIMLTKDGHVKLADLGLAKKIGGDTLGVTQTGAGMGTPYYMAPEQAEDARSVDHRADIYALGLTFLHLLTGKRPFEGESAYNIVFAHVNKPLPTGQELGTPLPEGVEAIIRKMGAKDPNERYQDYDTLLADLERAQAGQPTVAESGSEAAPNTITQASTEPEPARGARRRGREKRQKSQAPLLIGAAAVVLLVVAGVFFATRGGGRPDRGSGIPSGASSSVRGSHQKPDAGRDSGVTVRDRDKSDAEKSEMPSVDSGATTNAVEMLAYAETYAKEHPAEFAKVIERFREVERNCKGTVEAMKAKDAAEGWHKRWEEAAEVELEKRCALAAEALQAWKFQEAEAVWQDFPKGLRVASIEPEIEAEEARIEEARKGIARAMEEEGKPLLAKKPEELSAEHVKALTELLEKTEKAPDGLPEEATQEIEALAEKLQALLDEHEAVAASNAREAFDEFWAKYQAHMERKEFDEALKLCESSFVVPPSGGREEGRQPLESGTTSAALRADAVLLKSLIVSAEENLPSLKGKTVRISGMSLRVSDVRNGKIYAGEGRAQAAFDADRLDPDTLLKLGLAGIEDPKSQARAKGLHAFYFGKSSDAVEALKEAEAAGEDVSFYQSRMVPTLVVATTPAGAEVSVFNADEKEGEDQKPLATGHSPVRLEAAKNTTYRVEITKDSYQPVTEEVKIGEAGEFRVAARLKKARLPAYLLALFEVPRESKDKNGNPIRRGADRKSGMPLEIRHKQTGMHFVFIPAGEFLMGSPDNEKDRDASWEGTGTQHKVQLTKPFYFGKYEVTQTEWNAVMGNNPSRFPDNDRNAVEQVSWNDCQAFLKKLNTPIRPHSQTSTPLLFSLPTEAQWEYACRAGTRTRFYFGDDLDYKELGDYAWFKTNSGGKTHPVGEKKPNAWGLYDVSGNVWEWCEDWYGPYSAEEAKDPSGATSGGSRGGRGGSWHSVGRLCRSAYRFGHAPSYRGRTLGCRASLRSRP